jgi:hypothetical protein
MFACNTARDDRFSRQNGAVRIIKRLEDGERAAISEVMNNGVQRLQNAVSVDELSEFVLHFSTRQTSKIWAFLSAQHTTRSPIARRPSGGEKIQGTKFARLAMLATQWQISRRRDGYF